MAAKRVMKFSSDLTKAELITNEEKQSAVIYQLIIIGEATKRLSSDFRQEHPYIDWKCASGMRDILTHQYDKIDFDILWNVVSHEIPALVNSIASLLP
ncbi:MAG: HepT-like ribonuclease domain-containing protein [Cyanobacteria bacterium J06623_5]